MNGDREQAMKRERSGYGVYPHLILLCAMCLPAAPLQAETELAAPANIAEGNPAQPGKEGRVAAVTTAADGTRRYSIKSVPIREFSMRIGQSPRPIADPCADTIVPR
jgi:hypothetical protein